MERNLCISPLTRNGKALCSDENLQKINTVFYDILNIIRNENIGILNFSYNKNTNQISVTNDETNELIVTMSSDEFKNEADNLYTTIVNSVGSSFSSCSAETFLTHIGVSSLKARSDDKSDIRIKIHDINTGYEAVQGFSIKSRLGNPSTLINAGKTTNFIYEVTGNINDSTAAEFNSYSRFKERFDVLKNAGCSLVYKDTANSVFKNNLILIDGDLPKITADLLIAYYSDGYTNIVSAVDKITEENPLDYNLESNHPFYSYKFKKLLSECALGMTPSKVWNGTADATGGYIIVREDGEVLCYHLFNRNEFDNYLLKNTRFETASTSRHEFGTIYKENDKYYIKLNLQVRFIK